MYSILIYVSYIPIIVQLLRTYSMLLYYQEFYLDLKVFLSLLVLFLILQKH